VDEAVFLKHSFRCGRVIQAAGDVSNSLFVAYLANVPS